MTLRQIYCLLIDMSPHYREMNSYDPEGHAELMAMDPRKIWSDYKKFEDS